MNAELERLRAEIDELDAEVLRLLAERFRRVVLIARQKEELGLPTEDPLREASLAKVYSAVAASQGLEERVAKGLFDLLLSESKRHQRKARNGGSDVG